MRDPITNEIRYVGKTIKPLHRRLAAHIAPCELAKRSHKTHWLRQLKEEGLKPTIELVEVVTADENWEEAEQYWISLFKAMGSPLTNQTNGGRGNVGYKRTPEALRKASEKTKGRPLTKEHAAAIAASKADESLKVSLSKQWQGVSRGPKKNSQYVGVRFHRSKADKGHKCWAAMITARSKHYSSKYFATEQEAARAYNALALEHFGPDAKLNIIDD